MVAVAAAVVSAVATIAAATKRDGRSAKNTGGALQEKRPALSSSQSSIAPHNRVLLRTTQTGLTCRSHDQDIRC